MQNWLDHDLQATELPHLNKMLLNSRAIFFSHGNHARRHPTYWRGVVCIWGVGQPIVDVFKRWGNLSKEVGDNEEESIALADCLSDCSNGRDKFLSKEVDVEKGNIFNVDELNV